MEAVVDDPLQGQRGPSHWSKPFSQLTAHNVPEGALGLQRLALQVAARQCITKISGKRSCTLPDAAYSQLLPACFDHAELFKLTAARQWSRNLIPVERARPGQAREFPRQGVKGSSDIAVGCVRTGVVLCSGENICEWPFVCFRVHGES